MAPPQLARDAPVADVLHPVEVDAGEPLGNDPDATIADGLNGWVGQRLDAQVPLVEQQRLEDGSRSLAVPDAVRIRLLLDNLPELLELETQLLARLLC